jgi:hypothetical protein
MFSNHFQMSFKSGNLNFENEFRDGQARRDGQAYPLQSFLSLIVCDDFFGWWGCFSTIINRLRRFFDNLKIKIN